MMIYKNADRDKLNSILLFRTFFDFVAAVVFLFGSGWNDCKAVLKAHIHFHTHKGEAKKQMNNKKYGDSGKLIYPKSILFDYFIFNKKKFSDLEHFKKK